MKHTRARAALLAFLLLASAACARDDGGTAAEDDGGEAPADDGGSDGGGEATALDEGGFGDLEAVCQDGDASGATAPGVTDDTITVGTITDKGGPVQGLNEEMYDTAVAFTEWCNEHGGILGRELVLSDVDAKLFEYEPAITDACGRDFALVGGGAVFDEDPNDVRVGCDLPNIAGYVVSARGRTADLQVQPIPNAIYDVAMGRYNAAARDFPDSGDKYGIMASAIHVGAPREAAVHRGGRGQGLRRSPTPYDYQSQGETGWANFVREMKDKDIKILEFIGQPQNLIELTDEMAMADWHPDVILLSTNFYDELYQQGATTDSNLYIQSRLLPARDGRREQGDAGLPGPDGAVQPRREGGPARHAGPVVLAAVRAGGHRVRLGAHRGVPARRRPPRPEEWTGGGLHARQTPGNGEPSPCFLILGLDEDGFFYNEEATAPTDGDGLYNCDEENVFHADRRLQRVRRAAAGGLTAPGEHGAMEDFLANTVLGLSTAAIFALAASGLVLTYTTTGIFNFAHGAIAMLGAFTYWQLHVDWGWPIPLALATVVLVIAPGLGVGDRARDHARARRRAGDDPDHHHGEPARRDPRRGSVDLAAAGGVPGPAAVPRSAAGHLRRERHVPRPVHLRRRHRGGHRPAAAAVPDAGRPRHAGQRRQPAAGDAARRPARIAPPPPPGPSAVGWPPWPGCWSGR